MNGYSPAKRGSPSPIKGAGTQERTASQKLVRGCGRLVILTVQLGIIGLILAFIAFLGGYWYLSNQLVEAVDQVVAYQGSGAGGTPRFFDRHGTLLFELKTTEKRRWLEYEQIPGSVISATVAVEDDTFWQNPGFDPTAIGAAALAYVRQETGRPAGASTITQQLVRHIAFSYEDRVAISVERKIREIFLAFILTRQRSKEDIITMYLNEIYYGNLAYGIEAASQTYFGKRATDLTVAEASFLAGLPQAPIQLDPYTNFEGARERQKLVLALMEQEGMLNSLDVQVAAGVPLRLAPRIPVQVEVQGITLEAPHFVIYIQNQLEQRYGPDALTRGGWQITTSLDLNIQRLAEQAVREQVAARAVPHDVDNGAAVVLKPATGEILAMVGSVDYWDENIDGQVNVTLQPRQPGSSIKPITYAAAMEKGWSTGDVIWDVPITLDQGNNQEFVPVNYSGRYQGPVLFRDALANSYNIPPIQLIRDVGVVTVINTARRLGVVSLTEPPGFYGLTLTLGGGDVRLLELTHAYATLANMGQRPRLTGVLRIVDGRGSTVYDVQREQVPANNVLDPRIAYIITDILDDDQARIPGMGANNPMALPFPAAAKTGTTNDFRDNWTIGYTTGVVVGVWLGNTDGHAMIDSTGLRGAAPVWRRIVEGIYNSPQLLESLHVTGQLPAPDFPRPNGLEEREVCLPRSTGGTSCGSRRTDLFLVGGPTHGIARLGYVPDDRSTPGAWSLTVLPLPAGTAQQIRQPALNDGTQPPPPTHCVVNSNVRPANATDRIYLPIPPYYADEVRARLWNQRNGGYHMAPSTTCPASVLQAARGNDIENSDSSSPLNSGLDNPAPTSATYRITSPTPGQQVNGLVSIMGTASFQSGEVQFYKLEIGTGHNPSEWTTLGATHSQPVTNGILEQLHTEALPAGDYAIRLILVYADGNYPTPFTVPITVVH